MKKPSITKGEWDFDWYSPKTILIKTSEKHRLRIVEVRSDNCYANKCTEGEATQNAKLICTAGNLTNQGYNIESIPDLVKAFQIIRNRIETGMIKARVKDVELIDKAITKAKYEK